MASIISWIVLGFAAGAIARAVLPNGQGGGIFATTLLGILGAFVGGTIAHIMQTGVWAIAGTDLSLTGILVAALGAMLFVSIWSLVVKAD